MSIEKLPNPNHEPDNNPDPTNELLFKEFEQAVDISDPAIEEFYDILGRYLYGNSGDERVRALAEMQIYFEDQNLIGMPALVSGRIRPDVMEYDEDEFDDGSSFWRAWCEDNNLEIQEDGISQYVDVNELKVTLGNVDSACMVGDEGEVFAGLGIFSADINFSNRSLLKYSTKPMVMQLSEIDSITLIEPSDRAIQDEVKASERLIFGDVLGGDFRKSDTATKLAELCDKTFNIGMLVAYTTNPRSTIDVVNEYFREECELDYINYKMRLASGGEFIGRLSDIELEYIDGGDLRPLIRVIIDRPDDYEMAQELVLRPEDVEIIEKIRTKQEVYEELAKVALAKENIMPEEWSMNESLPPFAHNQIEQAQERYEREQAYSEAKIILEALLLTRIQSNANPEEVYKFVDRCEAWVERYYEIVDEYPEVGMVQIDGCEATTMGVFAFDMKVNNIYMDDYVARAYLPVPSDSSEYTRVRGRVEFFDPYDDGMSVQNSVSIENKISMYDGAYAGVTIYPRTIVKVDKPGQIKFMHEVASERYDEAMELISDAPTSITEIVADFCQEMRDWEKSNLRQYTSDFMLDPISIGHLSTLDYSDKVAEILNTMLVDRRASYIDQNQDVDFIKIASVYAERDEIVVVGFDDGDNQVRLPLIALAGSDIGGIC